MLPPTPGPIHSRVPNFHVFRLAPTPKEGDWLYVTAGLWEATQHDGHGLEFVLAAPTASDTHVETLTMVAYYHATGGAHKLDHGHTVPIGRPWIEGSACTYLLVSLPYPWGPSLEICTLPDGHLRILWLLPITKAEKVFRHKYGLEALERRFDAEPIIPSEPTRPSVVASGPGRLRRAALLFRHSQT